MLSEDMVIALVTSVGGVVTSSGVWTFFQKRSVSHRANTRLLMGLAYDKIMTIGMHYLERGWISRDEYEEFLKYFVEPYKAMGGNGVAEKIALEVSNLPFRTLPFSEIVVKGRNDEAH